MASRKDSKGRVLQKGEFHRKDGRYQFTYTNIAGKRCYIYADNLVTLRQKERDFQVASWQMSWMFSKKSLETFRYLYFLHQTDTNLACNNFHIFK